MHKVRLTGGEPLLRPGFIELVSRISSIEGITDLALTTNAVLLPRHATALKGSWPRAVLRSVWTAWMRQPFSGKWLVARVGKRSS